MSPKQLNILQNTVLFVSVLCVGVTAAVFIKACGEVWWSRLIVAVFGFSFGAAWALSVPKNK